ncbi:mobilization protein [Salmonella enterica subsp. enterica serovar Muenchen]|nr:mobilization protein [Salmonella enterica subsp. enterica serovar Muenchen]EDQ3995777.1 mobilization protein [Salmonella enterica subsp. enterica]EDU8208093.1 mobilization protein [Salmonella enterica subsp. diarizonae]EIX3165455.1 mobilization protein [Salmonella enterica]
MTELETHLLNALKNLQQEFVAQQRVLLKVQNDFQTALERTARADQTILEQVSYLTNRVEELSEQMEHFRSLYRQNRR